VIAREVVQIVNEIERSFGNVFVKKENVPARRKV